MRITRTATRRGNVYRFYKDNDNFYRDLRPLIPVIMAAEGDVLLGEEDDSDTSLLITAGPLSSDGEAELLRRAKRFLAPGCPSEPPPHESPNPNSQAH